MTNRNCLNCGYGSRLRTELNNPLKCVRCQTKELEHWQPIEVEASKPDGLPYEKSCDRTCKYWDAGDCGKCQTLLYEHYEPKPDNATQPDDTQTGFKEYQERKCHTCIADLADNCDDTTLGICKDAWNARGEIDEVDKQRALAEQREEIKKWIIDNEFIDCEDKPYVMANCLLPYLDTLGRK
jgi:hypothetical protein